MKNVKFVKLRKAVPVYCRQEMMASLLKPTEIHTLHSEKEGSLVKIMLYLFVYIHDSFHGKIVLQTEGECVVYGFILH